MPRVWENHFNHKTLLLLVFLTMEIGVVMGRILDPLFDYEYWNELGYITGLGRDYPHPKRAHLYRLRQATRSITNPTTLPNPRSKRPGITIGAVWF